MSGWLPTVVSNVAVACLVGGLAWLVGRCGRRASLAHLLWVVCLIKLVTPPLLWVPIAISAEWISPAASGIVSAGSGPSASAAITQPSQQPNPSSGSIATSVAETAAGNWWPRLSIWETMTVVWLGGFLFVATRGLVRFARFRRLLLREGQRDLAATRFVRQLLRDEWATKRYGPGRSCGPDVLRLPVRVSPMLFGFGRRPAIVCPEQLWRSLSDNQQQVLLAHEAAHFFRGDHWVRWLEWAVTSVYWWFPLVYVARRELERHEEAACDAWAVRVLQSTPRGYAEALLQVVDFLSDHRIGLPRMASGMQPTASLEQRLRMLMRVGEPQIVSGRMQQATSVVCLGLLLVHPRLQPQDAAPRATLERPIVEQPLGVAFPAASTSDIVASVPHRTDLPEPPRGFWNQPPRPQWASFSLDYPGAHLTADTRRGIVIERTRGEPLEFSPNQLSAIVEIPATQRVVIGDAQGALRLWDLEAGRPTSLIGHHAAPITSLTYHPSSGLVSADAAGSLIRWDLQSGQVRATWADVSGCIQSIRCSGDGQMIAVLAGSWNALAAVQTVHMVRALSLEKEQTLAVSPSTAVVLQIEPLGWAAVDWSGGVSLLETGEPLMSIAKHEVSAMVLSQAATVGWRGASVPSDGQQTISGVRGQQRLMPDSTTELPASHVASQESSNRPSPKESQ